MRGERWAGRGLAVVTVAAGLALVPAAAATGAHAIRDCSRRGSQTRLETADIRVYAYPAHVGGGAVTRVVACRKGRMRRVVRVGDESEDEPFAAGDFAVLGLHLAWTWIACDGTGTSCSSGVVSADLRTGRVRSAPAAPPPATLSWQTDRALPTPSGAVVFAATPGGHGGRIAALLPDGTVRELARGDAIDAESLAVAVRRGRPALVTWTDGTTLASAEI